MAYSEKVIDHYENPRNVGSFEKGDDSVGTGMVGAPACGDVMKLQIRVSKEGIIEDYSNRERVAKLAVFFRQRIRTEGDGAATWAYWPPLSGTNDTFEDISHASINVDFMVQCHEHGIVFTREDLERVGRTFTLHVMLADDRIGDHIGANRKFNTHRDAVLRWGRLAKHVPEVSSRLTQSLTLPGLKGSAAEPLGLALLSQPPATP